MTSQFMLQNITIVMLFLLLYIGLYRWNNQFVKNRFLLLSIILWSIVFPLLRFNVFPTEVYLSNSKKNTSPITMEGIVSHSAINLVQLIYIIGVTIGIVFFIIRLWKIIGKIRQTNFLLENGNYITRHEAPSYSFLNYIFINEQADNIEIAHEMIHVKKRHTWDKLLVEIMICFLWFNPFFYLLRYLIKENHEFEADQGALEMLGKEKIILIDYILNYYKNQTLSYNTNITNDFNSLTKNRIVMLSKNNFKSSYLYILIIPIILIIFSSFTFKSYTVYMTEEVSALADTLRGDIVTNIDTITTYNPETYEEIIQVVKSVKPLEEYVKEIKLSGKMSTIIDTVPTFDYDTKIETIEIFTTTIPMEFSRFYGELSLKQQEDVIREYGKQEIYEKD